MHVNKEKNSTIITNSRMLQLYCYIKEINENMGKFMATNKS